jgi:hypothetical protein
MRRKVTSNYFLLAQIAIDELGPDIHSAKTRGGVSLPSQQYLSVRAAIAPN